MSDNTPKSERSRNRNLIEWGAIIGLLLFMQFTPQGKVVTSWMQRAVLATGLITPDIAFAEENDVPASYDLELVSLDGEPLHLADLRGKVIFMNVWATWCPPCLAEMPYIQNLYEDVASEDIRFVMISADDTAETARRHVEAREYTFPVYRLRGPMPEPYTSNALPTTYVISADGRLATVHAGMANVDTPRFRAFLRGLRNAEAEV